jgi:hypothetical protein
MKKIILSVFIITFFNSSLHAQKYVAVDGSDDSLGTIDQPYATIPKAISETGIGDTVYVRGGTYNLTATITITFVQSGTEDSLRVLTAYQDEVPILDFSEQSLGSKGVSMRSNFWHIRGLHIAGAGDNGMEINFGSENIIENCSFYRNRDTGLQLSNGSVNNKIINCDSYFNADPPDFGDADGFAPKLTVGSGNYFYGCRAWNNCDDGWDGYLRDANDVTTTLENCWTWGNGYFEDGTDPGSQANGNGFKMGGGDNSNIDTLMHHNILINCVAFSNKNKGFDQNNNVGSMTLLHCTGYGNLAANYRIQRPLNPGQELIIKNSLSYFGAVQLGNFAVQETNSWLAPFMVTEDDFLSLDVQLASAPRQSDGSLPDNDLFRLAEGSDLIDGGVDLGYAFFGTAPDLGAFESNYVTSIDEYIVPFAFSLSQNYPNPFNSQTQIAFYLPESDKVTLTLYNILGQELIKLIDNQVLTSGENIVTWNGTDAAGRSLTSGVYFYRIELKNGIMETKKMVLIE